MDGVTKKKKSSVEKLFARYKTHDGEKGSPEQWAAQAQALIRFPSDNALSLLGLSQVPGDIDTLKRARREAMRTAHPDLGGDEILASKINEAYASMERLISLQRPAQKPSREPVRLVDPPRCTGTLPQDLEAAGWAWEKKEDGERALLYIGFDPYGRNLLANTFLSRHKSVRDGLYVDKSGNVPHISGARYERLHGTVLDGELFHTDISTTVSILGSTEAEALDKQRKLGNVDFIAFDIVFHKDRDVRGLPYKERRALLESVVAEMANSRIKVVTRYEGGIEAAFEKLVAAGGEGLIGKKLTSRYGEGWAKLKKAYTVTCLITGYRPGQKALEGQIGSLALSVYDDNGVLQEVGFASGMTNAEREHMTACFGDYLGKAVDVFCMEMTKDGRLRSPTYARLRHDVNPEDCTMEKLKEDLSRVRKNRKK